MSSPSTLSHLTTIAFVIGVGSSFAALLIMLDYFYPDFRDDWIRRRRQQHEVPDLELQRLPPLPHYQVPLSATGTSPSVAPENTSQQLGPLHAQ